jgi:hypothetical protein
MNSRGFESLPVFLTLTRSEPARKGSPCPNVFGSFLAKKRKAVWPTAACARLDGFVTVEMN